MTTNNQQPSAHPKWEAFKSSFTQSNYITDFWNWFMTLMSKAAEMVLFGTVLYSGYQLLPGVPHVPATVDAAIFVIQQGALDIGGMGLLKLAKRAGLPRKSFPVRLGMSLVVLMILNVVLASIKHTFPALPDGVVVTVETLLLIARAVVAVLFGRAIHALREEYSESSITIKEAHELQQRIQELVSELARVQQDIEQRLEIHARQFSAREGTALTLFKEEMQAAFESLTPEHLMARLTAPIETLLQEPLTVSLDALRHMSVSHVTGEISNIRLLTTPTVSHRRVRPASGTTSESTHLARIYALLDEDQRRKPADIQRLTGIPKATVYRLVERYHREHPNAETTARGENETNETSSHETETAS